MTPSDLDRALDICRVFLANREKVRERLLTYVNDGVRAQSLEQDRSVSVYIPDNSDEGGDGRPLVSDPTSAAAGRNDGFRQLLEDCDRQEHQLAAAVNALAPVPLTNPAHLHRLLGLYRGTVPNLNNRIRSAALVFQRALSHTVDANTRDVAGKSADGRPGCGSCSRLKVAGVPWFSEPSYNRGEPTDLGGELKRKVRICDPCYRFAIAQEPTRLPSVSELQHRHDDPRGHWPTRHGSGKAA